MPMSSTFKGYHCYVQIADFLIEIFSRMDIQVSPPIILYSYELTYFDQHHLVTLAFDIMVGLKINFC